MADYLAEAKWLLDHPDFEQKPATIEEFLGAGYLDIEALVRPGLKETLVNIFGKEVVENRIGEYEEAMVTGGIGVGKQLDPECPVLTPAGWVRIDSLVEGDRVVGRDGKAHSVTSVHHWNDIERYRITFKDGTVINAGAEHLWIVLKSHSATTETVSTETLAGRPLRNPSSGKYYYSIPLNEPVEYDEIALKVDPYLLGQLIGDGCLTRTVTLASRDLEVERYITLPDGVKMIRRADGNRWGFTTGVRGGVRVNSLLVALREYGLMGCDSYSKRIPEAYTRGSVAQRLELLRGLLDADGTASSKGRVRFLSANRDLAGDVADLVRSLGGYASINASRHPSTRTGFYYEVSIWVPMCPFNLERKRLRWAEHSGYVPKRYISSIEKIERGAGVCISVDAPDKLYIASNFIVTHNTTFASIAIPFMVHWVLCLRDPQGFFNLLPGSRIAFMQMSTSEKQALDVIFGDIKARVEHSEWFVSNYQYDPKYTKMIKFPKDIWVLPGDSAETTFEGYNILGGILDEMDSHKVTQQKDYAEEGFNTIQSRIASRFIDPGSGGHRGLLICIGQMKKGNGFAARKYDEMLANPRAYVSRMSIWESLGWEPRKGHKGYLNPDGTRDSFWYDKKRKHIVPDGVVDMVDNDDFVEIPNDYKAQFRNNPEKALRDLAGIPPATKDPFISLTDRIDECVTRWVDTHGDVSPVGLNPRRPEFQPWFRADNDPRRRAMHLDLAVSGDGDALGMTMGHVSELVDIEGELKPFITLDCLIRIKAGAGEEILLSDVRRVIYELRDERKFRLVNVTMDGFQCFTGDTKVPLLDGRTLTMQELAEQYPEGGPAVYSFDGDKIVPGRLTRAWKTASKAVAEVHLDNGEVIRCTPDHRFMLRDGTYRQAQFLTEGQSLMPLYRRVVVVKVVLTDVEEDVYDLEVAEYHNFALDAGVFVHNSTDTLQQLRKKKFFADYLSVDRTTLPYEDLREAIYERRLAFPPYMTYLNVGDIKQVAIAVRELQQLSYTGKKVDHPPEGSKDIADAMAGVVSTLMGDRTYRRGVSSTRSAPESSTPANEDWQSSLGFEATPNTIIDPFGNVLGSTGGDYTADPMSPLLPKRLRG